MTRLLIVFSADATDTAADERTATTDVSTDSDERVVSPDASDDSEGRTVATDGSNDSDERAAVAGGSIVTDASAPTDASVPTETPVVSEEPVPRETPDETDESNAVTRAADGTTVRVQSDGGRVVVTVGDRSHELPPTAAARFRDAVGEALTESAEFLRTGYERRADGQYAVHRRGDDEPAKVFDSFADLRDCYRSLPAEFDAAAVGRAGVSGSRRHLLVRHFVEHPAFDCRLTCRNPLTARKR